MGYTIEVAQDEQVPEKYKVEVYKVTEGCAHDRKLVCVLSRNIERTEVVNTLNVAKRIVLAYARLHTPTEKRTRDWLEVSIVNPEKTNEG